MPKLNDEVAEKVDQAESGFKPVDEGIYQLKLVEDVEVKEGPKGPYWKWTFVIPEGEAGGGRKFYTNTSLSDSAYFKIQEAFKAFGYPPNTDTMELVGKIVKAHITITTIQAGTRKGELGNEISKLMPIDADESGIAVGGAVQTSLDKAADQPLF